MKKFLILATIACMPLSAFAQLDGYSYSSGWNSLTLNANGYEALADEQSNGNYFYGAKSTGGIDIEYYSNGWQTYNIVAAGTTQYKAISNLSASYQIVAAGAGGLDTYYYDQYVSGNWAMGGHISNTSYKAVARNGDDASYNTIFALGTNGGLDRLNTLSGWQTFNMNSTSYLDITDDPVAVNQLYASKAAGGIDAIYYSDSLQAWTTGSIFTDRVYVSLVAERDPQQQSRMWGARADGGIDAMWYYGGWQRATIVSGTQYVDLDDYNGATTGQLYGVRADGKLDVIAYNNGWSTLTLGNAGYKVVLTDNAVGYGNVYAATPEPATLILLGLGAAAMRMSRKK